MGDKKDISYRIGIYVRESRDDNEENAETIETQRDLLVDFAQRTRLGQVTCIYMDDNVSGSAFTRPGLDLLKEDVVLGRISLLLLKDLSRLGRNNAKTLLFLDFLEENGVRILTFDGKYDSLKDNDMVGIETWINERYVRDVSRKIRTVLRFKIEKGEYLGHAPFGYIKSKEEKNKLVVDEPAAAVVREIYGLYAQGYGYSYIARILDSRSYPPPSGRNGVGGRGKSWNAVAVKRILCSRVYAGDTVQGVSEKISFKSRKTRRLPEEQWVVTENTHEAIISREEFEEVQKLRLVRRKYPGLHKGILHMLKGILFCGHCGSTLFARKRKNRPLGYICGNYAKNGTKGCSSHQIREKTVEDILLAELFEMFEDNDLKTGLVNLLEKDMNKRDRSGSELVRLEQQLLYKRRQQEILYLDRLENKISEQLFLRTNKSLEDKIGQISWEIMKVKRKMPEKMDYDLLIGKILVDMKKRGLTQEIVKLMVRRITVYAPGDRLQEGHRADGAAETCDVAESGVLFIEYNFGNK